jgi:hypothetical protein
MGRAPPEVLPVHLVKKSLVFCGTRRFITINLSQINPFYAISAYFREIHFNITRTLLVFSFFLSQSDLYLLTVGA